MDFDRLRAFVWTLEEGSISAAATRLCRTQPAVTRMLQTLEDQVGARLIDRRARPIRPTAAGMRVLDDARAILRAADRLTDGSLRADASRPTLRLGVSRSLLWHLHDARFVTPQAPLADTDFVVRSGWSPRLYRRFARGEFDGCVLLLPLDWTPDVPCRPDLIRRERLVLVGPRASNAPPKARATVAQLQARPWILNPDGCGFRHSLARSFAEGGCRLRVQFELDAAPQEHLAMVAAGVGCSIVPLSSLNQNLKLLERIQQLSVERFDSELGVWMLWSERWQPVDALATALSDIFRIASPASMRLAR
jgi:DNA-binding transcriptional LysR family regulator